MYYSKIFIDDDIFLSYCHVEIMSSVIDTDVIHLF